MKINKFAFILLGACSLQALHALEEVVCNFINNRQIFK